MLRKFVLTLIALLVGGYMLFDGVHVVVRGNYFGPEKPGPWRVLFERLGVDPLQLGPMFIVFGVLWLVRLGAMLRDASWGRYTAIALAVATLWYLPVGTVMSLIYIALLVVGGPATTDVAATPASPSRDCLAR